MADISQINVNNTTYDLKDSKAQPIFIRLFTNKKLAEATTTSDWTIFQFEDINGVTITHSNAYACLLRGSPLQMRLYFLASDSSGTYDSDTCYLLNWYYDSAHSRYTITNNYQEPLMDDNGCSVGYWSLSLYFNIQKTCILEAMIQAGTKYPNSDLIDLSQIEYDNTFSGLSATTTQAAIDELASEKADASDYLPLSAGSTRPLTDWLYTEKNGEVRNVLKSTTWDNTSSVGGVSTTEYSGLFIRDKNANDVGTFETYISNSGRVTSRLTARNQASGTETVNQLQLSVSALGARSVTVSDASVWREALGTEYNKGDSFSVAGTACLFLQTGTSARITIPLCKPVGSDVTSAANSGNWEIRDCNGSTTNGDKVTSGHPLSYYVTTPSSDLKVNIGTNSINILMTNLKASTWGSTTRYTVGSAYANSGNTITFS